MSKRLVMSILSAIAMSIGGFFVSCGSNDTANISPSAVLEHPERFGGLSSQELKALATPKPGESQKDFDPSASH
jgi:hypothetical protein